MARTEARITCAIWDDEDYRDLTWEAQWLYKTLLTQKDLSLCGVLTWTPKRFSKLASNASATATRKALDLLRQKRYVVLDDDTDELLVRSLIRRDRVLGNHNSIVGCSKAFEAIHSGMVRDAIVEEVGRVVREGLAIGGTEGGTPTGWLEGLPDHIRKRVGQPFAKAVALAYTRPPPGAPVPPATCLLPPASPPVVDSSSSKLNGVAEPSGESEEESLKDHQAQAVSLIADRQLQARMAKTELGPVNDRSGWLKSARAKVWTDHGAELAEMAAQGRHPKAMADRIMPPPPRPYGDLDEPLPPAWDLDDNAFAVPRSVGA